MLKQYKVFYNVTTGPFKTYQTATRLFAESKEDAAKQIEDESNEHKVTGVITV